MREAGPGETGPWVVEIPGWCPPSLNAYLYSHWAVRARIKKETKATVAAACLASNLPRATVKRRLSILLTLPPGREEPDEDNIGKALRDGLTACGALVDDKRKWCETGTYEVDRGELKTTLTLEDV